jgi:signal transduction histidine kinase
MSFRRQGEAMAMPTNSTTRRRLALLFAVPLAFSILFFVVNTLSESNDVLLLQTQQLGSAIGKLRSIANDAEVGEHGFLLTGDSRYLSTLQSASARLNAYVNNLKSFDTDQTIRVRWQHVVGLIRQRVKDANDVVSLQEQKGHDAAVEAAKSGTALQLMNDIRGEIEALQNQIGRETSRLLTRDSQLTHVTFLLFVVGSLTMLLVLLWLYNSVVSYLQARDVAHAQLQSLNAELESRIDERTIELKAFNEELQQFAYVASHDLQEPLRTIISFTQLLEIRYKGKLDSDADEFIDYIVTSARRMTDLINGLLALVRLRKSGQGIVPVSFEKLVNEAEKSLQAAIRENDAVIEHGPLPELVVEPLQFTQVLQNLISNAIKYRSQRKPHIVISAVRDETHWHFSVQDNGRGFQQQFADRIFGLFQRLHGREVEGTGMGLTIAKRIVDRHGGRIWASGTEEEGATFYFSLPVSLESRSESAEGSPEDFLSAAGSTS